MTRLAAGLPTAVGSLPHTDPARAAQVVLSAHPRLPAAPQLPARSPAEGMVAQWLVAVPGVDVRADGSIALADPAAALDPASPLPCRLDPRAHGGLLAFLDACTSLEAPPPAVKVQVTGPLTLGVALVRAGAPAPAAFARAASVAEAWCAALTAVLAERLPAAERVLFLDEPALVLWRGTDPPLAHEDAVDLLSTVLAGVDAVTGVHACGDTDRRLAIEAGPRVVGLEVGRMAAPDAVLLARFLEGGGWVAWGAVPTDGPVGDRAEHWWQRLVDEWCALTRAGCDPALLRTQALVTPACGLAGHGESQAERILRLTAEVAERVQEQAVGARLTLGA